ncbi:MAG: hydroxyphenylacetyl-CoA thioesterase PaaI, partial [Silicimonas sp.]|nr:hydroxyphenylacetyl-CoA thioesterase PaaI [Silicimonas sp.]
MTPEDRAARVAQTMLDKDRASAWIGMELVAVAEGAAKVALTVREDHLNGHGICHGGVTFALADTAFAIACNSRNQSTVAQQNMITYLRPGQLGDRLLAEAREISLSGRSGLTDVTVTNQDGAVVAEFRGQSRAI